MTWVIGSSFVLGGYGIMVSDIQVTVENRRFDILRKAYPVGPSLVGGFAGSVQIGFALLRSISEFLRLPHGAPPNSAWHPPYVAENWAPIAKSVFESFSPELQEHGSQFIIVGPDPAEDVIPGRAMIYVCKFSWPTFEPQVFRGGNTAVSIGSGSMVGTYAEGITHAMGINSGLMQAEVGNTGGWGSAMNIVISQIIEDHPVEGISSHIHLHRIERDRFWLHNNDRTIFPRQDFPDEEPTIIRMPPVAQSLDELSRMLNNLEADASKACC
ncbi:hypothetical protein [Sideroxydans sp. CL21]|uniref:hypothetical protein n=1 Tax=Sideroxydans sp. CL21 TaxID=2600596 RepID=UPI0024BC78FA|nr:hypothetical protein [Sideroxydans sp. CL21]